MSIIATGLEFHIQTSYHFRGRRCSLLYDDEEAKMDHPGASKAKSPSEQAAHKAQSAITEPNSDAKVLQARIKAEQKTRFKAEKALTEPQETLSLPQTEREQERQVIDNIEQNPGALQEQPEVTHSQTDEGHQLKTKAAEEKAEAEKTLEIDAADDPGSVVPEPTSASLVSHTGEQRASVITRWVVDETGKAKKFEIEDPKSKKKTPLKPQNGQRLVDIITSAVEPTESADEPEQVVGKKPTPAEKPEPRPIEIALTIKDAQLVCTDDHGNSSMIFKTAQPIILHTLFKVDKAEETESPTKGSRKVPYEIKVYAHRIDIQSITLVANKSAYLVSGIDEYRSVMQISDLPAGLYRLVMILHLGRSAFSARFVQVPFLMVSA